MSWYYYYYYYFILSHRHSSAVNVAYVVQFSRHLCGIAWAWVAASSSVASADDSFSRITRAWITLQFSRPVAPTASWLIYVSGTQDIDWRPTTAIPAGLRKLRRTRCPARGASRVDWGRCAERLWIRPVDSAAADVVLTATVLEKQCVVHRRKYRSILLLLLSLRRNTFKVT